VTRAAILLLLGFFLWAAVGLTAAAVAVAAAPVMDRYDPAEPTTSAVLVVHGGGFYRGSRPGVARLCTEVVVPLGFSCFAPDYRLAPEDPYPAANNDILAAYWAVRDLGFTEVAAWGVSAGGTLAAWLATRVPLATVVTWSAPTYLPSVAYLPFVPPYAPTPYKLRAASPALFPTLTPSALIVNSRDEFIPVQQARALADRYADRRLRLLDGSRHGLRYFETEAEAVATWLAVHLI
jgi:acetyl esterase/lipase